MTPHYADDLVTVYAGDCLVVLAELDDNSVDAIVTDPPYGLEFMGKEWDGPRGWQTGGGFSTPGIGERVTPWVSFSATGAHGAANPTCGACGGRLRGAKKCACEEPAWKPIGKRRNPENEGLDDFTTSSGMAAQMRAFGAWCEAWATECLRVLKPGGHLLAFGGTRTWHRLACAIEDAGFEVRDTITWLYGSGFPKSLDVSKAIAGRHVTTGESRTAAEPWQGWGTALKPASEPIVVARKPLRGTVAANVLAHGTGALNIDGCRVGVPEGEVISLPQSDPAKRASSSVRVSPQDDVEAFQAAQRASIERTQTLGRWPANVVLSHAEGCEQIGVSRDVVGGGENGSSGFVEGYEAGAGFVGREVTSPVFRCIDGCPVRELDAQSGVQRDGVASGRSRGFAADGYVGGTGSDYNGPAQTYGGEGGASRFFPTFRSPYTTRAHQRVERRSAPSGLPLDDAPRLKYEAKAPTVERPRDGDTAHPTVKPLDLMRWLVRLVTPPGGVVLDPFLGSGTTAEACVIEGFRCIGIEREPSYLPLITARLTKPIQPDLFGGAE